MRRGAFIWLAVLLMGSFGARSQHLSDWLTASGAKAEEVASVTRNVDGFVQGLGESGRASHRQLSKVFRKVHASYLKKYVAYSGFRSLFAEGQYDCLTATMLFSQVLTDLHYDFKIVETNYHIFLLVNTAEGQVLLESTDRVGGFITDAATIAERTEAYREIVPAATEPSQMVYRFNSDLYKEVPAEHLTGLLCFNQAVKAYNLGDWFASARFLEEGYQRYPTSRCLELADILVSTLVVRKDVSQEVRRASMEHLMPLILHRSGKVAANRAD